MHVHICVAMCLGMRLKTCLNMQPIGSVADPRDNKPKMVHVCPGKRPGQANPIGQGRAGKRGGSAGAAPFRIAFVNDGT